MERGKTFVGLEGETLGNYRGWKDSPMQRCVPPRFPLSCQNQGLNVGNFAADLPKILAAARPFATIRLRVLCLTHSLTASLQSIESKEVVGWSLSGVVTYINNVRRQSITLSLTSGNPEKPLSNTHLRVCALLYVTLAD